MIRPENKLEPTHVVMKHRCQEEQNTVSLEFIG